MPLALRLFEPRYLRMLGDLLGRSEPEFGEVLIERGHEVGGGDQRFTVGTMARILKVEALEGFMAVTVRGSTRFRVSAWLPDDPYPRAEVDFMPSLEWDGSLEPLRTQAEATVRHALTLVGESRDSWPADVQLSDDPVAACWQLSAITPVGPIDQLWMLQASSLAELLSRTAGFAGEAAETMSADWPDPPGD